MDHEVAVKRLGELGHSTRMSVFRLLVKAGDKGLPVGEIQRHLEVAAPTLSHHLHRLVSAGLVVQKRDGRTLHCVAQMDALREVIGFLDKECCTL
ncbi:MAG: helix-turn-helix transcriptional regulator [Proteobacteria bacterium]|nr:helix-turn-helix transcriptional regulator [Pseudomonadota bacterium]